MLILIDLSPDQHKKNIKLCSIETQILHIRLSKLVKCKFLAFYLEETTLLDLEDT